MDREVVRNLWIRTNSKAQQSSISSLCVLNVSARPLSLQTCEKSHQGIVPVVVSQPRRSYPHAPSFRPCRSNDAEYAAIGEKMS